MSDLGHDLVETLVDSLRPLTAVASDAQALTGLITMTGWDFSATGLNTAQLTTAIGALGTDLDSIAAQLNAQLDMSSVTALLSAVTDAIGKLDSLADGWSPPDSLPADLPQTLIADVLGQLLVVYLGAQHPRVRSMLELLGVLDYATVPAVVSGSGKVVRAASTQPRINLELAGHLFSDPGSTLLTRFGLAGSSLPSPAAASDSVFPFVADLLRAAGLQAWYGNPGQVNATLDAAATQLLQQTLRISFTDSTEAGTANIRLDAAATFGDDGTDRVLNVVPAGALGLQLVGQTWTADAALTGDVGPIEIKAHSVSFTDPSAAELTLTVGITRPALTDPMLRLGAAGGPRFEIGGGSAQVTAELSAVGPDVSITAKLSGVRIVADNTGDSFLAQVLPAGATGTTDLAVTWDPQDGLQLNGSPGMQAVVPLAIDLGPVSVDQLTVTVQAALSGPAGTSPPIVASLGIDASLTLGPLFFTITNIGIQAQLAAAPSGSHGNLGPVDLTVGIKPPDGIDVSVDAAPVSGVGFIAFDAVNARYLGVLALAVGDVSISAVGVLDTRLPGGAQGYSLVVLASATFPPVELGFGFSLNGIGGLVGVNRTADVPTLQAAARAGQLDDLMFPADLVDRAPQVAANLANEFPAAQGHFIIGPAVQLAWGTDGLVDVEVGVFIELSIGGGSVSVLRVALLGWIHLTLPEAVAPVVDLMLDVLGVVDLAAQTLSLDAGLRNSTIAGFPLTGQAAVRAGWGADPAFVCAIGGFNPHFQAPAGFPLLQRVALSIADGDAQLTLAAYLAVTSNTLQLGCAASLNASAGSAAVNASLEFDALVQFKPFGLIVDLTIAATVLLDGNAIMTLNLDLHLTGPDPWAVTGSASFHFLFCNFSVPICITVGPQPTPAAPTLVDLDGNLTTALSDPRSWQTGPPAGQGVVKVREQEQPPPAVHPLGSLTVRQHAVPLGQRVERYGPDLLQTACRYDITGTTLAGRAAQSASVTDYFAPAQFLTMDDADKLSAPSFEQMTAGVTLGSTGLTLPSAPGSTQGTTTVVDTPSTRQWDMLILDSPDPGTSTSTVRPAATPGPQAAAPASSTVLSTTQQITLPSSLLAGQLSGGSVAVNGGSGRGSAFFTRPGLGNGIAVEQPSYAVVGMNLVPIGADNRERSVHLDIPAAAAAPATVTTGVSGQDWQVVYDSEVAG